MTSRRGAAGRGALDPRPPYQQAESLAAPLPPLLVAADRVAATVFQGVHGRHRVGSGETFWQFRRYQPGDSTQRIDWRQSAKSQHVFIRQTEWEAVQTVWLWRDASASMAYRSSADLPEKGDRADILLLALASLLVRGGEHVALMQREAAGPPGGGRAALQRLALALGRRAEAASGLPAKEPLPRHGRLVLIGDFLTPLEGLNQVIGDYADRGVHGHLVQVLDPAEETLPFEGRVLFEGLESEGSVLFGRVAAVRQEYRRAFDAHQEGLRALVSSVGWTLTRHRTDHPPQAVLMSLFQTLAGGKPR